MPKCCSICRCKFTYHIPKSGHQLIWSTPMFLMIHPILQDGLWGRKEGIMESASIWWAAPYKKITTPFWSINRGEHQGTIGGNFVGFSHIAITPLAEDDPLPKYSKKAIKTIKICRHRPIHSGVCRFADRWRTTRPFWICKSYSTISSSEFEFTGRLENLPIPLGGDDVSGDSNIFTVGLWNNHLVKESSLKGPPLLIKSVSLGAHYPFALKAVCFSIFFDSPNKPATKKIQHEVMSFHNALRRPLSRRIKSLHEFLGKY